MSYDFILGIEFNGTTEERAFETSEETFSVAVRKAYAMMTRDKPNAPLVRLTYFVPPL